MDWTLEQWVRQGKFNVPYVRPYATHLIPREYLDMPCMYQHINDYPRMVLAKISEQDRQLIRAQWGWIDRVSPLLTPAVS